MVDVTSQQANSQVFRKGRDFDGSDACIPSFPALKSRRAKVFMNGVWSTCSDGNGSMAFAPRRLANNYGTGDSAPPLIFTVATSPIIPGAPTFPPLDNFLPTGYAFNNWNSDYTMAALAVSATDQGIQYRVVCAGLRIRYTGTELNRGGIIHAIEEPAHASLNDFGINQVTAYESHFRCAVTRDWCTLTYTPVNTIEMDYTPDFYSQGTEPTYTTDLNHYMGFIVQGTNAAAPFEYEAIALLEVIGSQVRDLKPASADMAGLSAVTNTVTPNNQKQLNDTGPAKVLQAVEAAVGEQTGMVKSVIKGVADVANVVEDFGTFFI